MTKPRPRVDPRRQPEIFAELRERAGVALPGRSPVDADKDWIAALLQIAARLSSEVTRRLDRVPQKNVHNFFDWIGVRGRAARAARLVAIFRRAPKAGPLIIQSRVRLQASTDDAPVIFETEQDLRILPGNLQTLVAVDRTADQIYLPPPGLLDPTVIAPPAIARKLKSLAAAGSDTIQVTPAVELAKADVLAVGGQQYRVSEVKGDLVTIEPPLAAEVSGGAPVDRITSFAPFASTAGSAATAPAVAACCAAASSADSSVGNIPAASAPRNWQEHTLYLGDDDVLNIEATARIKIGDASLLALDWFYWGKIKGDGNSTAGGAAAGAPKQDKPDWHPLAFDKESMVLVKSEPGAIEPVDVGGQKMRVLRAQSPGGLIPASNIKIGVVASPLDADSKDTKGVTFEAIANTTPVSSLFDFFPLGQEPHLFDSFYIGSAEAFSKSGANINLSFRVPSATLGALAVSSPRTNQTILLFGVGTDGLLYRLEYDIAQKTLGWNALKRPSNATGATDTVVTLLDLGAPALAEIGGQIFVMVASDEGAWCWQESSSTWRSLGAIKDNAATSAAASTSVDPTTGLVATSAGSDIHVFGLKGGKLFHRRAAGQGAANDAWNRVYASSNAVFASLSAVRRPGTIATVADDASGLVALDQAGKLYLLRNNISTPVNVPNVVFDITVQPLAMLFGGEVLMVAVSDDTAHREMIAIYYDLSTSATQQKSVKLGDRTVDKSLSLSVGLNNALPRVVFLAQRPSETHQIGIWLPDGSQDKPSFVSADSADRQVSNGVAVVGPSLGPYAPGAFIVPGSHADILMAELSRKFSVCCRPISRNACSPTR